MAADAAFTAWIGVVIAPICNTAKNRGPPLPEIGEDQAKARLAFG
jgi:hypothetical protein